LAVGLDFEIAADVMAAPLYLRFIGYAPPLQVDSLAGS
jgi:hypothetical protein